MAEVQDGKPLEKWFELSGPEKLKVTGAVHLIVYWSSKGDKPNLQPAMVAEGAGQLFLSVLSAHGLEPKDRSGTSDPYAVVKFNGQKYKTYTIEKTLDPVWDQQDFYFEVPKAAIGGDVRVEVYDFDVIGKDDSEGVVVLPLSALPPEGKDVEQKYKLVPQKKETVAGELKLRMSYVSSEYVIANEKVARERYAELLDLITARDCVLVAALCDAYQSNDVAHLVVSIFESAAQAHRLLNQLCYREITRTKQETTLFRTDSMSTKCVRSYLRLLATDYLRATIGPLIDGVMKEPKGYEVDPAKAAGGADAAAAAVPALRAACDRFLRAFTSSVDQVPMPVKTALGGLHALVAAKYPTAAVKAVGGFWFLRFACPAIFSPEGFDLIPEPPSKDARRALTLISKVLQNAANGVPFGKKEPFMEPLNSFVTESIDTVAGYFKQIAVPPTTQIVPSLRDLSEEERVQDMAKLVRHLSNNYPAICKRAPQDERIHRHDDKKTALAVQLKTLGEVLGKTELP